MPMTHAQASRPADVPRPLQGEALVAAWERGSRQPRLSRALALLAEGYGLEEKAAATLSIPRRDALLLALRQRSFGDALQTFATCGCCAERLEFTLSAADLMWRLDAAALSRQTNQYGPWSLRCRH